MLLEKLRLRAGRLIEAAAALVALATLLAFGGRWWWVLELLTHFRVQYLVGLLVGALCAIALRHWRIAAAFGVFAAINLAMIVPLYAIDHVLVSPEIAVARRTIGPDIGSDHRPVIVDLRLGGVSGRQL